MRKMTCALVIAALTLGAATLSGHGQGPKKDEPKPDEKKVKELMRKKLEYSQKVLEGLALNDLDKVAKNAEELKRVRKEAAWRVIPTAEYELWGDEFNRSLDGMIKAAKDKNLEKAKLDFLGMTMSCFHCHTYVRDMKKVSTDADAAP
jgi:hypothetical protein